MYKQFLYDYQYDAVDRMKNGCILNGGVGSGKSRTGLYYYFKEQGGQMDPEYKHMTDPQDLYIITTAMKRDSGEWEDELLPFALYPVEGVGFYKNKVVIDSWNNIKKYVGVENAFFIFDEDRVTGYGTWTKSFLKIAKNNNWIILSATPGDTWEQYIPVFVANGFYKNKTAFEREHVVWNRFCSFPKIDRYVNTGKLIKIRRYLLIDMDFTRKTIPHHNDIYASYDTTLYKKTIRTRWDPFKNEPIEQASSLCYILRRIVNSSDARVTALLEIMDTTPKAIIFYNFDYELELLHSIFDNTIGPNAYDVAEWNGHKHQPIPDSDRWVYFVNYNSGAEGWNCITTDTIIFFSQNYSYKTLVQASGRIDRLNTPFTDLYYYHLKSRSGIDLAISKALNGKKKFNEKEWVKNKFAN